MEFSAQEKKHLEYAQIAGIISVIFYLPSFLLEWMIGAGNTNPLIAWSDIFVGSFSDILYIGFLYGFYILAKTIQDRQLRLSVIGLIVITALAIPLSCAENLFPKNLLYSNTHLYFILPAASLLSLWFGFLLRKKSEQLGKFAKTAGLLNIISSVMLLCFLVPAVGALIGFLGLLVSAVADIYMILLLGSLIKKEMPVSSESNNVFKKLGDFAYTRNWKEAIAFYVVWFLVLSLGAGILSMLLSVVFFTGAATFQDGVTLGLQVGYVIAITGSLFFSVAVCRAKKLWTQVPYILLILLSGVLAGIIGGLAGMIVPAFLTTRKPSISPNLEP